MEVPLNLDPKQCIDSLHEAKENFLVASNAYEKTSNLHGTHIIESYLKRYLDPERGSAENLKQRTHETIAKIKDFHRIQISITSEIMYLGLNIELAISELGLKGLEKTLGEFGKPLIINPNDPLSVLKQQSQNSKRAMEVSTIGIDRLHNAGQSLIVSTIRIIEAATTVLNSRSENLVVFSENNLNKITALKRHIIEQAEEEKNHQIESQLSNSLIQAISVFFDCAMDELPTGTLLRLYKRLRTVFIGKEIDFSKSDVEKIDLLLDMFVTEQIAFEEFEMLLSSTSETLKVM